MTQFEAHLTADALADELLREHLSESDLRKLQEWAETVAAWCKARAKEREVTHG